MNRQVLRRHIQYSCLCVLRARNSTRSYFALMALVVLTFISFQSPCAFAGGKSAQRAATNLTSFDVELRGWTKALSKALSRHPGYDETAYYADENNVSMSMHAKIISALDRLRFELVPGPIAPSNDRGQVELHWQISGSIQRLALQDIATRKVTVDSELFEALRRLPSQDDLLAFLLHEALIRVYHDDALIAAERPLNNVEKIAALVYATFPLGREARNAGLSAKAVAHYLCDAKIPAAVGAPTGLLPLNDAPIATKFFPQSLVAFAMTDERCEVMQWWRESPAEGIMRNQIREWTFINLSSNGKVYPLTLRYSTAIPPEWQAPDTVVNYENSRPESIPSLTLVPYTPMNILRLYMSF